MRSLRRQGGVAVITALLLTTLAVTIVASLFWQQQVQVRSMENQRLHLQIQWILRGTLDWTKLILQQDGVDHAYYTSLQHVWAVPVANTRIDQYIDRERVQGEVFDASLSGKIIDANSRFNLTNLANAGKPATASVEAFKRLLTQLRLDPGLATTAMQFVAAGQSVDAAAAAAAAAAGGAVPGTTTTAGTTTGAIIGTGTGTGTGTATTTQTATVKQMQTIELEDLLDVPGFTVEMLDTLRKYVVVLPERTSVNANTASAEVIAAVIPNFSLAEAQQLVATRDRAPWIDKANFETAVSGQRASGADIDVKSTYFLVQSWLKLDRASLNTEALVKRTLGPGAVASVVWVHQN
jgi:general secretion pathway protein K